MTDRISKQLNFIKEIDKMKNVLRMTLVSESVRRENDAEHSWHLAMMALLLEEYAARPVDITHVLKMTLVHDLVRYMQVILSQNCYTCIMAISFGYGK